MIELKEYTKEAIAAELNINADKASNIVRKLSSLGYKYTTAGKGRTYRIYINELPKMGIKEFAEQYLGIRCNSATAAELERYLYMITLAEDAEIYANMCASALEWKMKACNDTIDKWISSCLDKGLLKEDALIGAYYSTKKRIIEEWINDTPKYTFTRDIKEITREEFEEIENNFNKYFNIKVNEIEENKIANEDEAMYRAIMKKLEDNDYWWACHKKKNFKTEVNNEWEHYSELIELLKNYNYEPYEKIKIGDREKEEEEREKKECEWASIKERKEKELKEETQKTIVERGVAQVVNDTNSIESLSNQMLLNLTNILDKV